MPRFLVKFLSTRRFAIYVMGIMLAILIAGAILPSTSVLPASSLPGFAEKHPVLYALGARLGIQAVVSSPFFLVIPLFLFTSILVCTALRVRDFFKGKITVPVITGNESEVSSSKGIEWMRDFLKKRGWKSPDGFLFFRGRAGFFGSIIFHAGMLILFSGIAISSLTNFRASLLLVEGRRTSACEGEFLRVIRKPVLVPSIDELFFTLLRFNSKYDERGTPVEYSVDLLFEDERANIGEKKVGVNKPLSYRGLQATLQRGGITPHFVIQKNGGVIFDAEVNLFAGDFFDMFNVYDEGLSVHVKFFPDMGINNDGTPYLISRELKKPGFLIELNTKDNIKFSGAGYMGEDIRAGNYLIRVESLKHWAELELSRDYGLRIILVGIITIITGLVIRFIDYDRWILLRIKEGRIFISGRARFFNEIFKEELNNIIKMIEGQK